MTGQHVLLAWTPADARAWAEDRPQLASAIVVTPYRSLVHYLAARELDSWSHTTELLSRTAHWRVQRAIEDVDHAVRASRRRRGLSLEADHA